VTSFTPLDALADPTLLEGSHTSEGYKRFSRGTKATMQGYLDKGWSIVLGADWRLSQRPKWTSRYEVRKVAQTNGRRHGKCVRVVWAVKLLPAPPAPLPLDPEAGRTADLFR
jgi:hypothetical protein